MALTDDQRRVITHIDTRVRTLLRAGQDATAIITAMSDQIPAFYQLLRTTLPGDIERLATTSPGFYRYAKILEELAIAIPSDAIPVSERSVAPQQTRLETDWRARAAEIDHRMRQLIEEEVPRSAIIERMKLYVVELGAIWPMITGEQLATLRGDYPGFDSLAGLMEEVAAAEFQKPGRAHGDLTKLPEALQQQLSSLLSTAANLEREYQLLFGKVGSSVAEPWLRRLNPAHGQWEADLKRFRSELLAAGLPQTASDMVLPLLDRLVEHVATLRARLHE